MLCIVALGFIGSRVSDWMGRREDDEKNRREKDEEEIDTAEADSPGMRTRIEVVDPPYMAPK